MAGLVLSRWYLDWLVSWLVLFVVHLDVFVCLKEADFLVLVLFVCLLLLLFWGVRGKGRVMGGGGLFLCTCRRI